MTCAAVQLRSNENVEQNLMVAEAQIRQAAAAGAAFIATPENTAFLRIEPATAPPVQPLEGSIVSRMRSIAEELGVLLLIGSIQEEVPGEAERYANTSVLIDGRESDAPIAAVYRKMHLFDIDMPGGEVQRESDYIARGNTPTTAILEGWCVGLTICYDLRFPALYQRLVSMGANILTVPSAFTEFTGKDHWLTLLRARAIENQCYVIAPNQWGHHGGKRRSFGKSAIIDPWGITLGVAPDRVGFTLATLSLDDVGAIRSALPCQKHKHPDL